MHGNLIKVMLNVWRNKTAKPRTCSMQLRFSFDLRCVVIILTFVVFCSTIKFCFIIYKKNPFILFIGIVLLSICRLLLLFILCDAFMLSHVEVVDMRIRNKICQHALYWFLIWRVQFMKGNNNVYTVQV